jgi:recombination protein RecT
MLPKMFDPAKFLAVVTKVVTEKLADCDQRSIVTAMLDCASTGLDPNPVLGEAYLIPFYEKGTKKAQFIPGYKGLRKLALETGHVHDIAAEIVYEADTFGYQLGINRDLTHRPTRDTANRGPMVAVYAVAYLANGIQKFIVLERADVMKIKASSKALSNGPWVSHEEEMWRKTAIRRLCKELPLSQRIQRAVAIDEQNEAGVDDRDYENLPDAPKIKRLITEEQEQTIEGILATRWVDAEAIKGDLESIRAGRHGGGRDPYGRAEKMIRDLERNVPLISPDEDGIAVISQDLHEHMHDRDIDLRVMQWKNQVATFEEPFKSEAMAFIAELHQMAVDAVPA